jgi:hypothetical protein
MRKPTVEAMLSYSTEQHGKEWAYAVNTALDETGATLGPLLIAFILCRHYGAAWLVGSTTNGLCTTTQFQRSSPVASQSNCPRSLCSS